MTLDFDEILPHIGEWGKYQQLLFWLVCVPACLPCAFHGFVQVFMNAIPPHWCNVPQLGNFTLDAQKILSIPQEKLDGEIVYSSCTVYDVEYDLLLTDNMTLLPNTSWPKIACQNGWNYDHKLYEETMVTEVNVHAGYSGEQCNSGISTSLLTSFSKFNCLLIFNFEQV